MRSDAAYRKITAAEFLEMDFGTDKRFELHDGVIYMMAGRTEAHSLVQGNIFAWLRVELRGSGCRAHGPDMALQISEIDIRYPDVTVYCDAAPRDAPSTVKQRKNPLLIVEVLSPSTSSFDQGVKLEEYRGVSSVRTIALVDPVSETCRTIERLPEGGWSNEGFSDQAGISVPALGIIIPHVEIFARD